MRGSILVDGQEGDIGEPWDRVYTQGKDPQEGMNPSAGLFLCGEGYPNLRCHSELGRQSPEIFIGESDSTDQLLHQPRRLRGNGVIQSGQ